MSDHIDDMSGLSGSSYGDTFKITWDPVQLDEDPDLYYVYEKLSSDTNSLRFGPMPAYRAGLLIQVRQKLWREEFKNLQTSLGMNRRSHPLNGFTMLDDEK